MSSDSDDLPIRERLNVSASHGVVTAAAQIRRMSPDGSPVPEWISQATPLKHQVLAACVESTGFRQFCILIVYC
jgi:hypothetical protein